MSASPPHSGPTTSVDVMFLDHHGVTIGGESVGVAFDDLYYLERACRQQVLAQSTGLPLKLIPEPVLTETSCQLEQVRRESAAAPLHGADARQRIRSMTGRTSRGTRLR